MAEKFSSGGGREKRSLAERGSRFGRDFNIVVGSVALAGAFIAPPALAAGLTVYAGFNYLQAGGFEAVRRFVKKRDQKAKKPAR